MKRIPVVFDKDPLTVETTQAAIILGLKQRFDWLISKYRQKIFLIESKLIHPGTAFSEMDWVEASVRHAIRTLLLDAPFRAIQRDFICATRNQLPALRIPFFDIMCDLMGNTRGYWMQFEEEAIAPFRPFAEVPFYNYRKERALYFLAVQKVPLKHLTLDRYGKSKTSPDGRHPFDDECLREAATEAIWRKDFKFFVQIGDVMRKPEKSDTYDPSIRELQGFLVDHWNQGLKGVGPLFALTIKGLEEACKQNKFGNLNAGYIEKTRQRLGLITVRHGKIGSKDYIVNW